MYSLARAVAAPPTIPNRTLTSVSSTAERDEVDASGVETCGLRMPGHLILTMLGLCINQLEEAFSEVGPTRKCFIVKQKGASNVQGPTSDVLATDRRLQR